MMNEWREFPLKTSYYFVIRISTIYRLKTIKFFLLPLIMMMMMLSTSYLLNDDYNGQNFFWNKRITMNCVCVCVRLRNNYFQIIIIIIKISQKILSSTEFSIKNVHECRDRRNSGKKNIIFEKHNFNTCVKFENEKKFKF